VPYAIYRGEIIRSERGGLIGKIYDSERLDLRVSLGGSLPVNNKDNKTREGMPDLDLMLEVGPSLQYRILKNESHELRFDLLMRAALEFGNEVSYEGVITSPRFYYIFNSDYFRFKAAVGPWQANRKYQAYFYDVKKKYETPKRAEYKSGAGYLGTRYALSFGRRFDRLYVGSFVNYYDIEGARNIASPLVKKTDYLAVGLAISWVFAESGLMVNNTE